jgi:hypothetical protein
MFPSIATDEDCFFTPDFERVHWTGVIVFVACFLIPWSAYKEIKHIPHPLDIKGFKVQNKKRLERQTKSG